MIMLSVLFCGHQFTVIEHQNEPWAPVCPFLQAMRVDPEQALVWTQNMQCFQAKPITVHAVDRACDYLCIPLRKLFGWLMHFPESERLQGIDDALYSAWIAAKPPMVPADGRVMLTVRNGLLDSAQHIPDDYLVAPLEGFHHLASKAGYRVMAEPVHELLYAPRF